MKKIFLGVISILLSILTIFTISGCSKKDEGHKHNYSSLFNYSSYQHWHECSCGEKKDIGMHNIVYGFCIMCNYCEYSRGLSFTLLSNDTYQVSGIGTCKDTNLIIQDEYNGKAVTSIGNYAFSGCSSLKSIEIPNSVTSIGEYAF